MAKTTIGRLLAAAARESARKQRLAAAEQRHRESYAKHKANLERASNAQSAREAKAAHLQEYIEQVEEANRQLRERERELSVVLNQSLSISHMIDFAKLRIVSEFDHRASGLPESPSKALYLDSVEDLNWFTRLFQFKREAYQKAIASAESRYELAVVEYQKKYEQAKKSFELKKSQNNDEVEELHSGYLGGEAEALTDYFQMVLGQSEYPDGFPCELRLAYVPESQQLVIDYLLPPVDIVSTSAEYKYVKVRDAVETKQKKPADVKHAYQDLVCSIGLRCIHEVFSSDIQRHIMSTVFSGFVEAIDPSTGQDIKPYLISVRCTREQYSQLDLRRLTKLRA